MKSDRNLVECKIGYTEQFAFDTAYRFEADRHGRYVAEIHDQAARAFFLTNSSVYSAVPDEPESGGAYTPPAPAAPLPPRAKRAAPKDPDGNEAGNEAPAQPDPQPEPEQNPAPAEDPAPAAQDAPGIGDQPAEDDDDAGEANEPEGREGDVLEGTEAPADATDETAPNATRESLEAMTKTDIIALAEKLDVVVVKRDTKAEIIDQLLAGLD